MDKILLDTLIHVGLTEKEAAVLLALFDMPNGTATMVAQRANLKRSVVYLALDRLIKKGYVQEMPERRVRRYVAMNPTRILNNVQANVENFRQILPLLRAFHQGSQEKPLIEFFEGKEAILPIFRTMERAHRSYYLSCWDDLQEYFPEEVARWSVNAADARDPNQVKNLIIDDTAGRKIARSVGRNPKQEFRLLSPDVKLKMNLGIADNIVAITNFSPLFAVVVHSRDVAECCALLFELAWKSADPLHLK